MYRKSAARKQAKIQDTHVSEINCTKTGIEMKVKLKGVVKAKIQDTHVSEISCTKTGIEMKVKLKGVVNVQSVL